MAKIKIESRGITVHKKLKSMFKKYGVMMTGVFAEIIGQIQAERSVSRIKKIGNLRQQIENEVSNADYKMNEPTQSCGQASNDVCELLLGKGPAKAFHNVPYVELSADGSNLISALQNPYLSHSNLLLRFEMDRASYPNVLIKVKNGGFNPETSTRNTLYLSDNKLYFFDRKGTLFDLGQNEQQCKTLFDAIGDLKEYCLCDPFVLEEPSKPEDFALCEVASIFNNQKENFDCWLGAHSFTLYMPHVANKDSPTFYPYQAYFGSHTLQDWFSSNKDEFLSLMGIKPYIEKLALLGRTKDILERSDVYSELFSKAGREMVFCAHINQRREQFRLKFKITEVFPELALRNLQALQKFIDTNPGKKANTKVTLYKQRAKTSMTMHLEQLLEIKPQQQTHLFWYNPSITEQKMANPRCPLYHPESSKGPLHQL